ncbi:hypothetical protein [Flavivirga spongiicola]|uniref:Uncharacterized protein n=1 Tax=Flavivirga spongiicola TaxID=421621 RepID=A0ABU7XZL8_9FLAO|nr:hypothetical protein [Flavivirga sp. MEBiC05379]MDO5980895.1 hypothetical protein [Flavivirga sp. MEBiC05379]
MAYNYAYQTEKAVIELTQFDVKFCKISQSYLINNELTNTYINSYYKEQVNNIKSLLYNQLKTGLKHKEFLGNLMSILEKRNEWLEKKEYKSINFFENYPIETIDATYFTRLGTSNKTSFENYLNNIIVPNVEEMKAYWFLDLYKKEFNDYKNIIDFEKGLLLYIIMLYKCAISNLHSYFKSIYVMAEFIDFKNLNLGNLSELEQSQKKERIGKFNLDKKSVAHLFRILMDEKIILFHETDEIKNESIMKNFVEQNFKYQNTSKEYKEITTFNRECSEAKSSETEPLEKQLKVIDSLVNILENRKNNITNRIKKNVKTKFATNSPKS